MITFDQFRKMALSFPETEEKPHFEKVSFRWKNKIFATYHEKEHRAMLLLPLIEQSVFCDYDSTVFFPLPGVWGKKGATFTDLQLVRKNMFKDALQLAYNRVALKTKASVKSK